MGTLLASTVGSRGVTCRAGFSPSDPDDDHSSLCIICASIFCFTFAMSIFFSLKQEAVWAKVIIILIMVLSIILLCALCRKNKKKTLPVEPNRTTGIRRGDVVKKKTENKMLSVQPSLGLRKEDVVKKDKNKTLCIQSSRIGFEKENTVAFLKRITTFLFPNKTETPNSYCLESEMTTKIQSSLPV